MLKPMEESGCVVLGRRAPSVACVVAGVCGGDFLEEGAGTDDMCAEREDAGAEGRVGRVDEGVGRIRKGAHELDDVVVCAITAAVVGVKDGEAVVWGWGAGRTGAVEDDGPCRPGVAGEEEDFGGELVRCLGTVSPPAVGTGSHNVVAVDEDVGEHG